MKGHKNRMVPSPLCKMGHSHRRLVSVKGEEEIVVREMERITEKTSSERPNNGGNGLAEFLLASTAEFGRSRRKQM
jgi:hypothetical protein